MKEEEPIFGTEPDRLMRLMRSGFEADESELEDGASKTAPSGGLTEQPGTRIGRYKLLRTLGEGGMGIVYLAEQQGSIRRRVALKVIKPGMDSKRILARFEAERQALALLDHPNIAHVYDSGTTEAGRPYFVMEHVKGLPITEHCDHHKLTIEQRLRLFQQVCQAVHHAHQKGIIHRDIKPSNILVSIHEDQAVPKIIDFGVAKAIAQPLTERTLYTEQGQVFGTPEYMSPEQADLAIEDIDTRSDIYSLGVLLYELLTGVLPFDPDTLRKGGIENIRKVIRETDPKTPSTRLSKLGEEAKKIALSRRTEIATLAKKLHRELEWIPLKAMRKERADRYRSASEVADDIENYLKGAPLIAGPPSTIYRAKKFVRRNRALVTSVAAIVAVLAAGVVVSTLFALRAQRQAQISNAVATFLRNDLLASVDPTKAKGREITVGYLLDAASASLEGKFNNEPLIEASIRETLGWTYRMLGKFQAAELHLERARQIRLEQLGEESPETLRSIGLAAVYRNQGQYDKLERLCIETLKICRRVLGEKHTVTLSWKNQLALGYECQGRYTEAEGLFLKLQETTNPSTGGREEWDDPMGYQEIRGFSIFIMGNLARVYRAQGRYDEAEQLGIKMLEVGRSVLGEESPWFLIYSSDLAMLYTLHGQHEKAESLYLKTIEMQRRVMGEGHRDTLVSMNGLAVLRTKQKHYNEAESLFSEVLKTRERELGEDHPDTLETKHDLATLYKEQGDYDKAELLLLKALEGRRLKLGDGHPFTLESWNHLIALYEAWNKPDQAAQWRENLPQSGPEVPQ